MGIAQIKEKYVGQALAVVMIVLVVAVIIALAIISRAQSEQHKVTDERSSSESASVAEIVLKGLGDIPVSEVASLIDDEASNPLLHALCNPGSIAEYEFLEDGCVLNSTAEVVTFLEYLDQSSLQSGLLSGIADLVSTELETECGSDESSDVTLSLTLLEEGEKFSIPEGEVFSLVSFDQDPGGACSVNVTAEPGHPGAQAALIHSSIYYLNGTGYKEYDYSDTKGVCLFDCLGVAGWEPVNPTPLNNGWDNPGIPATFTVPVRKGAPTSYLEGLRLRSINDSVIVSYTTTPSACVELEEIVQARVVVNCAGTSRGRESVFPKANWAPALFDFVLYNGEDALRFDSSF